MVAALHVPAGDVGPLDAVPPEIVGVDSLVVQPETDCLRPMTSSDKSPALRVVDTYGQPFTQSQACSAVQTLDKG